MNRVCALILLLTISSCSSVPLSTMARMSTFDAEDFVALNPDELQVKVILPEGFELDTETSWLGIDMSSSAGQHQGVFDLREKSVESGEISTGFFSEPVQSTSYLLSLTESSRVKFTDLQQFVGKATADAVSIRVVPKLASRPKDATSVNISVDLRLSESQGFFTLVDSAQLPLGRLMESEES
ncbi:MAG: hypothetical protein ABJ308_16640 [Halieaceae bacterium]